MTVKRAQVFDGEGDDAGFGESARDYVVTLTQGKVLVSDQDGRGCFVILLEGDRQFGKDLATWLIGPENDENDEAFLELPPKALANKIDKKFA